MHTFSRKKKKKVELIYCIIVGELHILASLIELMALSNALVSYGELQAHQ